MYLFSAVVLILNLLIIGLMPKHVTRKEIYITWGILSAIAIYTDLIFGHTLSDLFDFGPPGVQFWDLIFEATLDPSFGIIFINFMPVHRKKFIPYLLFWVAFSLCFEWLSVKVHYLNYKGWSLLYSAPIYLMVFLYLRWHL